MDNEELKFIREQLETRSEEVQEIMGFIPNWLIRWGITVIFITILVLLIGSWFFRYPEILTSSIIVTTKNPPANIIAKSSGKFERIFIKDGDKVKKDDLLAIIENTCNYTNFQKLINIKNQFEIDKRKNIRIDRSLKLGELQAPYEIFIKAYQDYLYLINDKLVKNELELLKNQLDKNKILIEQSLEQKNIQKNELELFKKKYNRAKDLITEGIISKEEFENSRGIYLQKEYGYKGAETKITNLELQIEVLNRNIITIRSKFEQEKKQLILNLQKSFKTLSSEISIWEQKYILRASIKGVIVFTKYRHINQNVKIGDRVLTIIPESKDKLIGRVLLPILGSGKVKIGQEVNVKFDNYPFMEYGMVRGKIISKSRIATDDKYILEVVFTDGLKTNYKKELKFNQEMKGIAEIITEDMSLLERLFSKFKVILNN